MKTIVIERMAVSRCDSRFDWAIILKPRSDEMFELPRKSIVRVTLEVLES